MQRPSRQCCGFKEVNGLIFVGRNAYFPRKVRLKLKIVMSGNGAAFREVKIEQLVCILAVCHKIMSVCTDLLG